MFRNISFMLCSFYERQQTKKLRRSRGGVSAVFGGLYRTVVPYSVYAPESVRIYLGTCPGTLLMHRHGAFVSVFLVCLGFCLCNCAVASATDPRRGGQRERVTITYVIVRICESLPISPTPHNGTTQAWFSLGLPLRRGHYR